ncbi:hypothetical protein GCM10027160_18000 [Streptomyces calidiresistens]|uniref:Lipoprotein n=1 Tax=Streptomyces calidiresistens TaxID=1485586 RepID=A0A7W3XVZ6_9ACTN|nr:hypothetical protein [Streptomyces calidiresistens]MBB0229207.1 hypothetical protein [Streptomyces calidiresistens]
MGGIRHTPRGGRRGTGATLVALVAATALTLTACGDATDDNGAPGTAPPTGGETAGGDTGGEDDTDAGDAGDAGGDAEEPSDEAFHDRAEDIEEQWPEVEPLASSSDELWRLEGVVEPDPSDTTVTALVGHGDCDLEWGARVHETEDLIILGGWSVEDPDVEVCTEVLLIDEVAVELDSEVGDRVLVDAVTGMDLLGEEFHTTG